MFQEARKSSSTQRCQERVNDMKTLHLLYGNAPPRQKPCPPFALQISSVPIASFVPWIGRRQDRGIGLPCRNGWQQSFCVCVLGVISHVSQTINGCQGGCISVTFPKFILFTSRKVLVQQPTAENNQSCSRLASRKGMRSPSSSSSRSCRPWIRDSSSFNFPLQDFAASSARLGYG